MNRLIRPGRTAATSAMLLAAGAMALSGCGPVQTTPTGIQPGPGAAVPGDVLASQPPPPPAQLGPPPARTIQHSSTLDTSRPRVRGAYPAVTAGCALPNVNIGTGARTTGEALLGGGYSTSGSIEIRDSFPSTAFGEPVADGSLATAWTVVFAGGDGGGSGIVWVNCSTESGVGTRVFSHALGGQTSAKAVCPAGQSVTGGGYRSGWDAATYFVPRVVASYPDPDQRNAWTVWETITNYNADTHPSPQGTAYIVCASAGLSTTVVAAQAIALPPDPALSNPLQDPNCSKPGGPLLPTCSAVRHGDTTATCSSGLLVGASAITLRDTTPAYSGVGTRPAQSYAIDGGMYLTASVPAKLPEAPGPTWSLQVRYNQLGSPTDPLLAKPLSLRTLTICAA